MTSEDDIVTRLVYFTTDLENKRYTREPQTLAPLKT